MYTGNIGEVVLISVVFVIVTVVLSVFSPFEIGFVVFSIVRAKTVSEALRKVSLVFQILFSAINFILALVIALLFFAGGSMIYISQSSGIVIPLAVIFGASFVLALNIIVIVWESLWLKKSLPELEKRTRA
jgi:hypothetical protein